MAEDHLLKVRELFQLYDTDADNTLSLNELVKLLEEVGNRITALPAVSSPILSLTSICISRCAQTAQVASQQGKYLGKKLHKLARKVHSSDVTEAQANGGSAPVSTTSTIVENKSQRKKPIFPSDETVSKPFRYFHLGSLAYIGNAAVFDFGKYGQLMGGLAAMYAWRSVYWNEGVSSRTRALLMIDWIIRGIWGRDLSRL
mgnify:CR=1 FL=1